MGKFYTFFKNNKAKFLSIIIFSFGIVLIMLFFPKERKFEYEYQQNKIWRHRDLFAPFSFSIDKTEAEIKQQRDSVLKEFSPFYDYDSTVYKKIVDSIQIKYSKTFGSTIIDKSSSQSIFQKNGFGLFEKELANVYSMGILDIQKPYKTLIIQRKSQKLRVPISQVMSLTDAHLRVMSVIPKSVDSLSKVRLQQIIYESMLPNLIYDDSVSNERKTFLLSKVSEKYGFINEGSRIISRGSVVSDKDIKILDSLKKEYESATISAASMIAIFSGQFILIIMSCIILLLLIIYFDKEIVENTRNALFIVSIVVLFVALAGLSLKFNHLSIYIIPYVALPIVVKNFLNARVALFVHIITMLIIGFIAPNSFDFVFLQITAGVIALFSIGKHYQRSSLFLSALFSFITYGIIFFALSLLREGNIEGISWLKFIWFGVSCVLVLTTYLLIFIFERIYKIPSDLTLFELTDTNRGLLRELNENAPGTFQHSLLVANLTEVALRRINGNALLGRVAGLYHDIGKLSNPAFYIENQSFIGNPHDSIPPEESAKIIINHVIYGKELARKNNLPHIVTQMIYSHHGNSKTEFFLDKFKNENPSLPINEDVFRYPPQKVTQKELAVLMIADTIEATSRSFQIQSKEQIVELVAKVIDNFMAEKQFDEVDITLKELQQIKQVLIEKLINMLHARIPYPQKKLNNE